MRRHSTASTLSTWVTAGTLMAQPCSVTTGIRHALYGLIYAKLAAERIRARPAAVPVRAAAFAPDFMHWFAADGAFRWS